MKKIKKIFSIFFIVCLLLLLNGCSHEGAYISDSTSGNLSTLTTTFEKNGLRTYIEIYEQMLFYMEMEDDIANFYVYDFSTSENTKIYTINNFALKGTSNVFTGDNLLFFVSVYDDNNALKNVLYVMNFSDKSMQAISDNNYSQKLIPLTQFNENILALQMDVTDDSLAINSFIEEIDINGDTKQIELENMEQNGNVLLIYIDSNGECLCAIEKCSDYETTYNFVKYDSDFNLCEVIDITNILNDYNITESIGTFYAFDDYFCITDYSNNTIVCKEQNGEVTVLLYEEDVEYIRNSTDNGENEFFFQRWTNDVYRLDVETGEIYIQNYDLGNDTSVIRCALMSTDGSLLIVKPNLSEENNTECLYVIPQEN